MRSLIAFAATISVSLAAPASPTPTKDTYQYGLSIESSQLQISANNSAAIYISAFDSLGQNYNNSKTVPIAAKPSVLGFATDCKAMLAGKPTLFQSNSTIDSDQFKLPQQSGFTGPAPCENPSFEVSVTTGEKGVNSLKVVLSHAVKWSDNTIGQRIIVQEFNNWNYSWAQTFWVSNKFEPNYFYKNLGESELVEYNYPAPEGWTSGDSIPGPRPEYSTEPKPAPYGSTAQVQ